MSILESPSNPGEMLYREHETYINNLARKTSRAFYSVDEDDCLQEMWEWLWKNEAELIAQNRPDEYVRACLKNVMFHFGQKMRNQYMLHTDQFYYTPDEVKEFLPVFFDGYDCWQNTAVPFEETMTPGDNIEMFCDFRLVFDRMSKGEKSIIQRKYEDDETFSLDKDKQAHSRAIKKFMTLLNQQKDIRAKQYTGPGQRRGKTSEVSYD